MNKTIILVLLIMTVIISGCSEEDTLQPFSSEEDSDDESDDFRTANIVITNSRFNPSTLTISEGTIVVWTNKDIVEHAINSDVGDIGSRNISEGETVAYLFNEPGIYKYHCGVHPSIKGTIIVAED